MAIAHDATSQDVSVGAAGGLSLSHAASGADRYALNGIVIRSGSVTPGSPAYGGVAMTPLGSVVFSTTIAVYLFGLVAPATGAQTVATTMSGGARAGMVVSTFTGVDQANPLRDQGGGIFVVTASLTSGNPTLTVTSAVGELVWDCVGGVWTATNTAFTVDASQTQRANGTDNNGSSGCIFGASEEAGAAAVAMDWTKPINGEDWVQGAVSLVPAGAAAASAPPSPSGRRFQHMMVR